MWRRINGYKLLHSDDDMDFSLTGQAIYHTLNLFNLDVTQKCLIAECWIPVADMETIQMALRRGTVYSPFCAHFLCVIRVKLWN